MLINLKCFLAELGIEGSINVLEVYWQYLRRRFVTKTGCYYNLINDGDQSINATKNTLCRLQIWRQKTVQHRGCVCQLWPHTTVPVDQGLPQEQFPDSQIVHSQLFNPDPQLWSTTSSCLLSFLYRNSCNHKASWCQWMITVDVFKDPWQLSWCMPVF